MVSLAIPPTPDPLTKSEMKPLRALPLLLLLTLSAWAAEPRPAEIVEVDRIVAVVNDDVITNLELEHRLDTQRKQMQARRIAAPPAEALRKQVLERLVLERLQLALAKQLGVQVEDETVNQVIGNIADDSKLTLAQFREVLERDGVDFAAFREEIRNEVIISRLRNRQVENKISVLPSEVDALLEAQGNQGVEHIEYHIAHLLVALPEAPGPEQIKAARERADGLLAQLHGGADFEQLAIRHSDGPNALEGGDLGWRRADQLPTLFARAVPALAPGAVSDLIRSPSGFHIVKLLERRGETRHVVRQTHARHILIKAGEGNAAGDERLRIERLHERIAAGEDFAELARTNSQDPGSRPKGGDLGWTNPGDFVPEFEQVMDKLAVGALSEPVKSPFGWHLIQVLERRTQDDTDEFRRNRARAALREQKVEEALQSWLRRLRDEAYVELRLNS